MDSTESDARSPVNPDSARSKQIRGGHSYGLRNEIPRAPSGSHRMLPPADHSESIEILLLTSHRRRRSVQPGDYVNYPDDATILLAGKLPDGPSDIRRIVGAMTDEEFALIADAGSPAIAKGACRSSNGICVARVQQ